MTRLWNALAVVGTWLLAALLTPFRVVATLVLLVVGGLKGRTNIKRARARYLGLAADLGIERGQVLIRKFDGRFHGLSIAEACCAARGELAGSPKRRGEGRTSGRLPRALEQGAVRQPA